MKFLYAFLFLIVSYFPADAQFTTNVYWTDQTEMPASEVIYYNPLKKLTWQDFKGDPATTGIIAAITMSGFGYKASMRNTGNKGQINIGVYCYFSKPKSWVKPDKKTQYILTHEQHHFDVSFIAASMFVQKLKGMVITAENCNTVLPRVYRECCAIMNKLQDDYDGQTKNGQLKEVQFKWNDYLDSRVDAATR
ncbi:MAG: hypothetical protein JWQ27_3013 [Ferruginibacter sp.]|nr:hypothetical protein [Ferruginibacter sp.]